MTNLFNILVLQGKSQNLLQTKSISYFWSENPKMDKLVKFQAIFDFSFL